MRQIDDGKYIFGRAEIEFPAPNPTSPLLGTSQITKGYVEVCFNRDLSDELFSGITVTLFTDPEFLTDGFIPQSHQTNDSIITIPYEIFMKIESELINSDLTLPEYSRTENGISIDTTHIGKDKELDPRDITVEQEYIFDEEMFVSNRFYAEGKKPNKRDSKGYNWNKCCFCGHTTTQQTLSQYHKVDPVIICDISNYYLNPLYVFDKMCFLKILFAVQALLETIDSERLFVELV